MKNIIILVVVSCFIIGIANSRNLRITRPTKALQVGEFKVLGNYVEQLNEIRDMHGLTAFTAFLVSLIRESHEKPEKIQIKATELINKFIHTNKELTKLSSPDYFTQVKEISDKYILEAEEAAVLYLYFYAGFQNGELRRTFDQNFYDFVIDLVSILSDTSLREKLSKEIDLRKKRLENLKLKELDDILSQYSEEKDDSKVDSQSE